MVSTASPGLTKHSGSIASAGFEPMLWLISVSGSRFVDAEKILHVARGGVAEFPDAVVGVAAVRGIVHRLLQGLADRERRKLVGLAHAEVQQFHMGPRLQRGHLGPLDLLELVNLVAEPEPGPADAFRK